MFENLSTSYKNQPFFNKICDIKLLINSCKLDVIMESGWHLCCHANNKRIINLGWKGNIICYFLSNIKRFTIKELHHINVRGSCNVLWLKRIETLNDSQMLDKLLTNVWFCWHNYQIQRNTCEQWEDSLPWVAGLDCLILWHKLLCWVWNNYFAFCTAKRKFEGFNIPPFPL